MAQRFLLCILTVFIVELVSSVSLNQELSLLKFLLRRQFDSQTNETDASTECFNLYLPQLQATADQWSSDYADCYNNADNKRYNFIEQLKSDQISINDSSNDICNYIQSCQSMNDALDYFKCFGDLSQNVVTTIYVISNNASDDATLLAQQLDGINSDLYICTNNTQRAYVEQTADIFDALDDCLIYGLDASSTTTVNFDELEAVTAETDIDSTTVDGSGDAGDANSTAAAESTTSNENTTQSEHTTIPIMSV